MIPAWVWRRALKKKTVWFSLAVMLALGLVACLAPWLAPHDPYEWSISQADLPPMWVQNLNPPGRPDFPLGSDRFGRDILSRLIYGTSTALFLALAAVGLAGLIGTLTGLVAGYVGGKTDAAIQLLGDIILAIPGIMLVVMIILIFRGFLPPSWPNGLLTLVVGFAAVSWAGLARLVRIQVIQIKSMVFIEALIALGASPLQIITRHLLTNVQHIILVWVINNIPAVILLEAVLGYIGVGITSAVDGGEFTAVSWGGLFFAGRSALVRNPFMLIIPSLCILLISTSFILLADFLNDALRHDQS